MIQDPKISRVYSLLHEQPLSKGSKHILRKAVLASDIIYKR